MGQVLHLERAMRPPERFVRFVEKARPLEGKKVSIRLHNTRKPIVGKLERLQIHPGDNDFIGEVVLYHSLLAGRPHRSFVPFDSIESINSCLFT